MAITAPLPATRPALPATGTVVGLLPLPPVCVGFALPLTLVTTPDWLPTLMVVRAGESHDVLGMGERVTTSLVELGAAQSGQVTVVVTSAAKATAS